MQQLLRPRFLVSVLLEAGFGDGFARRFHGFRQMARHLARQRFEAQETRKLKPIAMPLQRLARDLQRRADCAAGGDMLVVLLPNEERSLL